MTGYKKGDLVLVTFPFSDQTFTKKRPAVIISSDLYNANYPDVVILAITSKITGDAYVIKDWKTAGLLYPSAFKPVISTVEQKIILKKLGRLSKSDLKLIDTIKNHIFGAD